LNKVTQVNNYRDITGTALSREPDWGTWYEYTVNPVSTSIWTIQQTLLPGVDTYPLYNPDSIPPLVPGAPYASPPYNIELLFYLTFGSQQFPYNYAINPEYVPMTPGSNIMAPEAPIIYASSWATSSPYSPWYKPGNQSLTFYAQLNGDGGSDFTNLYYAAWDVNDPVPDLNNPSTWIPTNNVSNPITITNYDGIHPLQNTSTYLVLLKSETAGSGSGSLQSPYWSTSPYGNPYFIYMTANPIPPDTPTIIGYTPGNNSLNVRFNLSSIGSGPITDILYTTDNGITWLTTGSTTSPIIINKESNGINPLVNLSTYTISLVALNSYYSSISTYYPMPYNSQIGGPANIGPNQSLYMSMTPSIVTTLPDAPVINNYIAVVNSYDSLLSFNLNSDGGSPITNIYYSIYDYTLSTDGPWISTNQTTSPITFNNIPWVSNDNQVTTIRIVATTVAFPNEIINPPSNYIQMNTNYYNPIIHSYRPGNGSLSINFDFETSYLNPTSKIYYTTYDYASGTSSISNLTSPLFITNTTATILPNTGVGGFISTIVPADKIPTYYDGFSSYPGYFKTPSEIINYSYLPRSYGIAPAVGNAIDYPLTISTAQADIPNGYVAVPFYYDSNTSNWLPGSFYGLSYTRTPCLPSTPLTGDSPYFGPPGPFAWSINGTGKFELYNADQPTYKPYYFNTKISFNVLDKSYNPATDLSSFGYTQGISGEYQDTCLFVYQNSTETQDLTDVSTVFGTQDRWVWGQESNTNYSYFDDNSGYNFLSYLYNIPVSPYTTEYAIHVRAYDPIAKFNTGLRFIGKNYTDFGTATLSDIANDITSLGLYSPITDISGSYYNYMLVNSNDSSEYNAIVSTNNSYRAYYTHRYADTLITFSQAFSTTQSFGTKIGYAGIPFTTVSYQDALTQYINFYNTVTSNISQFTNILSTATGQLNVYILNTYGNILPPNALPPRSQFTAPIPFQFLFSTYTQPPYSLLSEQWGLGYNLGFSKIDTTPPRVTIVSETFIRIVQDYVYLRLNPEFNMNKMGVTNKENLSETRDPSAEDQKYFSKIILNDFATYCRTAIQRPVDFMPILGQLNTISCQLVDRTGNQINNVDCEYDLVLEITELESRPVDGSTLLDTRADLNVIAHTK